MSTTKSVFTLPATIIADIEQLTSTATGIGLGSILGRTNSRFSRDRFLSEVLATELGRLRRAPQNTEAAAQVLRREMLDGREAAMAKKVNIVLDSEVASSLDDLCRTKRIPRDLLMQGFLEKVSEGLRRARDIANDPTGPAWMETEPYARLHLSEEDLEERLEVPYVIEALAAQKRVGVGVAQRAYWKLPRNKRRMLRTNADIKAAVRALKSQGTKHVDLSEFLPSKQQIALRLRAKQRARTAKRRAVK